MDVTPSSQMYAVNPIREPKITRNSQASTASLETAAGLKLRVWPVKAATTRMQAPPASISMLVARNGDRGSGAVFEKTDPHAHEADASTSTRPPTRLTRLEESPFGVTRSPRPTNPSSRP